MSYPNYSKSHQVISYGAGHKKSLGFQITLYIENYTPHQALIKIISKYERKIPHDAYEFNSLFERIKKYYITLSLNTIRNDINTYPIVSVMAFLDYFNSKLDSAFKTRETYTPFVNLVVNVVPPTFILLATLKNKRISPKQKRKIFKFYINLYNPDISYPPLKNEDIKWLEAKIDQIYSLYRKIYQENKEWYDNYLKFLKSMWPYIGYLQKIPFLLYNVEDKNTLKEFIDRFYQVKSLPYIDDILYLSLYFTQEKLKPMLLQDFPSLKRGKIPENSPFFFLNIFNQKIDLNKYLPYYPLFSPPMPIRISKRTTYYYPLDNLNVRTTIDVPFSLVHALILHKYKDRLPSWVGYYYLFNILYHANQFIPDNIYYLYKDRYRTDFYKIIYNYFRRNSFISASLKDASYSRLITAYLDIFKENLDVIADYVYEYAMTKLQHPSSRPRTFKNLEQYLKSKYNNTNKAKIEGFIEVLKKIVSAEIKSQDNYNGLAPLKILYGKLRYFIDEYKEKEYPYVELRVNYFNPTFMSILLPLFYYALSNNGKENLPTIPLCKFPPLNNPEDITEFIYKTSPYIPVPRK